MNYGIGAQAQLVMMDHLQIKHLQRKIILQFPSVGDYKSKTIKDYDVLLPHLLHVKDYDAAKRSVFIIR